MKPINLPKGAEALSEIFAASGHTLYLVGGYVRNLTLGLPGGDFDVCSAAEPHEAAAFLRRAGANVIEKAVELGTIEVHLTLNGKKNVFEHTTFRRDYYPSGGEHRPKSVVFTGNIAEDARRRDFTVNALYLDMAQRRILDPTGRGLNDIRGRIIRAADDPDITIRDDGLRIMRMVRFAAELGFSVNPELRACAAKYAHLLADISAERKRDELKKILMSDTKYPAAAQNEPPHGTGLETMRDTGVLAYVLPRLCEGDGVRQSDIYHAYDVLGHEIAACTAAPPVWPLRLAALLHDIGKPAALKQSGNMYGHEKMGTALADAEMAALKVDKKTRMVAGILIENHMFDLEGRAKPKTIRRRAVKLGRNVFEMLIALRRADFIGSGRECGAIRSADNWQAEFDRMMNEGVPWTIADLTISGDDIKNVLAIEASQAVGRLLCMLHDECVMHPNRNKRDILMRRIRELSSQVLP